MSLEEPAESEHRHRQLVESLPDAVVVHTEGRIVFANPFALRLHKARTAQQLLGHQIADFIAPQYLSVILRRVQECYTTGAASPPLEFILMACDGSAVDAEA